MTPWKLLDSAQVPGDEGELQLYQRGDEYSIKIAGGGELMSSRVHGSEEALAELTCARLTEISTPRLLIGGLGMGFTLSAALRQLGADAQVEVAELVPAIVSWNRTHLGLLAGQPLEDSRTRLREGDITPMIKDAQGLYDAILLDVDNGPEGLTRKDNDWLYSLEGLAAARQALRPNGVLAIWSISPDPRFTKRLRQAKFNVEEVQVRPHGSRKRARHTIWLAR